MLDNTYDVSGYRYGVLMYPKNFQKQFSEINDDKEDYKETSLPIDGKEIVSFDNIDGITIKELRSYQDSLLDRDYLLFVMYDSILVSKLVDGGMYSQPEKKEFNKAIIRYAYAINIKDQEDKRVEEVITTHFLETMPLLSQTNQNRALCFLQRYMYGTKEETKKKVFQKEQ